MYYSHSGKTQVHVRLKTVHRIGSSCFFNRVFGRDLAGIARFGMIHLCAGHINLMAANQQSHIALMGVTAV